MKDVVKKYFPMTETSCYILLVVSNASNCGYGIAQEVKQMTNGRVVLGNGTLYGTLGKMVRDGVVVIAQSTEKKKMYELTAVGVEILEKERERIAQLHAHLVEGSFGV